MSGVARYLNNWIDGYLEYTEQYSSPEIFRRWTACSILAAVMERKVWCVTRARPIYPSLYALLVGPPGVGKNEAIRSVYDFVSQIDGIHLAATDVSSMSLLDEIAEAERKIIRPMDVPPVYAYNATTLSVPEFGVFLKAYDNAFMSKLNDLWDGTPIKEAKRGKKEKLKVDKPFVNLIAGTTPAWLGSNLPPSAWQEGFSSRLVIVFSGQSMHVPLFGTRANDAALEEKLIQDLRMISELFGLMRWDEAAASAMEEWAVRGMPPIPDHPRLESYCARRVMHMVKLTMIHAAARGNDMIIRLEDYQLAQAMLLEAEEFMPDIFKSMSMSTDANILEEAFNFTYQAWMKENKKPIKRHRIINFIRERAPVHAVMKVFETMEVSRMIKVAEMSGDSNHGYVPIPKAEHGR